MGERIGVIGGGIVGIAIARALSRAGLGDVTVFEKEPRLATHQTGHNSGVVHAGLYYAPGSLKARLRAEGRASLRDFCLDKGLPFRELGKLVVAVDESELPALDEIERRGRANKVPSLSRVDGPEALHDIEPHVRGIAAVHSPHTAAVDYVAITEAMAQEVVEHGGRILLSTEVTAIRVEAGSHVVVSTSEQDHVFDRLIAAAGLQSDLVGRLAGADPSPRILPFRGEYWTLNPDRENLVRGMIYPVPDPRFPFLGVHATRGVYDRIHLGPNAVPAFAREGYRWRTLSWADSWGSLTWPGAPALARKHWRMGLAEISGSLFKTQYLRLARRYIPELRLTDLIAKEGAGVRAQAWARDGSLLDDFAIDALGPITVLRNAPSPAATSSMAIADYVVDIAFRDARD